MCPWSHYALITFINKSNKIKCIYLPDKIMFKDVNYYTKLYIYNRAQSTAWLLGYKINGHNLWKTEFLKLVYDNDELSGEK